MVMSTRPVATLGSFGSNLPTACFSGFFNTDSNLSTTLLLYAILLFIIKKTPVKGKLRTFKVYLTGGECLSTFDFTPLLYSEFTSLSHFQYKYYNRFGNNCQPFFKNILLDNSC